MRLLPMRKISRHSKRLALFLTFCAGYVDAYTFIIRGNTLVAGQTGNVVFLSVGLIQDNVSDASAKVMTLISFMVGVFLLTVYKEKLRIVRKPILSLIPLAILSLIIGFVPLTVDNIYSTTVSILYGTCNNSIRRSFRNCIQQCFYDWKYQTNHVSIWRICSHKTYTFFKRRSHLC